MSNELKVIKISLDGSKPRVEKYTIEDSLESLKEQVGGWIEPVSCSIPGVTILCDEDGKPKQKPINFLATLLSPVFGDDWIVGDVLLVGTGGESFESVPYHVEESLLTLFGGAK
jgi:hypothetical protein